MISRVQFSLFYGIVSDVCDLATFIYSTDEATSWWTILKQICTIVDEIYQLAMTIPCVQEWLERLRTSLVNQIRNHDTDLQEVVVQRQS